MCDQIEDTTLDDAVAELRDEATSPSTFKKAQGFAASYDDSLTDEKNSTGLGFAAWFFRVRRDGEEFGILTSSF